jgi:hypothetical protein
MNKMNKITHVELSKNNANLDFKESNTTESFKYYKKLLEERKERERFKRHKYF